MFDLGDILLKEFARVFFCGAVAALTTFFTIAKLLKIISWSWWWVLSPFWIPAALLFVVAIIMLIFAIGVENQNK